MRITKTILCDLTGYALRTVDVAVGDNMTRAVCCRLQENGVPWIVPAGAEVSVAYLLPDGTPGRYAQMPDGRPAAVIDGSSVTVLLSDRISAQTGIVMVSLVLTDSSGAQLATFPFRVVVSGIRPLRNPAFYPALGAEFAGKLLYGGPGGAVTPLEVGEGLELDGGKLAATGGGGDPYIASDEPPEDTDALWINTSEPKEAVALGVTAVETVEGVEFYATDELGTTKGLVRHGKDGAPGEKGDPGEPGRTPVKGEDYFTPSEIEDVARQAAEMVEVPEGGGGSFDGGLSLPLLYEVTTTEEVRWIDTGKNAFNAKNIVIIHLLSKATATNTQDNNMSGSIHTATTGQVFPYTNTTIMRDISAGLPKQYDKVIRAIGFRGENGMWTFIHSIRNCVNTSDSTTYMQSSDPTQSALLAPITGIVIGDSYASSGAKAMGAGSVLKIWGC